MTCSKQIVLTGYRVQYVDLREPKPRTPREEVYIADQQWHEAMGLVGQNVLDAIVTRYERAGYHAYCVEKIKPKRVAEIDLCRLWDQTESPATVEATA